MDSYDRVWNAGGGVASGNWEVDRPGWYILLYLCGSIDGGLGMRSEGFLSVCRTSPPPPPPLSNIFKLFSFSVIILRLLF